jgi:hypothetical protein
MRRAVLVVAAACLLTGPIVLAFFAGGYHTEPRLVAALATWILVALVACLMPGVLPRTGAGRAALGGLVALALWSAVSIAWAPLGGPAVEVVQRLALYVGALLLALGVLRSPSAMRAVEPALAAGATVVVGYGLAGRLLPGLIELARSRSAGGRLEQPITYWNGEGAVAAMGLVLCARVAGDRARPSAVRALAAAAAAPLGAGLYLTYSRGAIAVAALGLAVLVAMAPTRAQVTASAVALAAAAVAAAAAAAFPAVASAGGTSADRTREGAIVLALVVLVAVAAAAWTARRADATDRPLPRSAKLAPFAAAVVLGVVAGLVVGGLAERQSATELATGADATRLTTASSNRYEYWRVGARAFADHPVAGLGAAGFRVEWLRERTIPEAVRDAHSLEVEIAAELGLVGLAAFAAMVAGMAVAARRALRRSRATAAGWCAALLVWLLHASIDWDWQLPAVTLPAIVLAGAVLALSEASPDELPPRGDAHAAAHTDATTPLAVGAGG